MAATTDKNTKTRIANTLTWLGAVVGGFGALAMLIKLKITITPEMQNVLFYKGLFIGSAVLIALGAVWGRQGRKEIGELEDAKANELASGSGSQLGVGTRKDPLKEKL